MRILVILQCAYATDEARRRQLQVQNVWMQALMRSHTGRRLRGMLPEGALFRVINASTNIGTKSSAVFPPDPGYILAEYMAYWPDVVLACGQVAQQGCRQAGIGYVPAPHPAWRALTRARVAEIRRELEGVT